MPQSEWIAGRYEILAEIGRGGMGLVARAFDHRLETEVAIKVLRPDVAKDSGDRDSLIKEARVLARLTHPNIVRLFDLADTERGLMLVLEFVRGPNLAQAMDARGRLTLPELLHIVRHVCAGLAAAHSEGVIHRDLKPPNLLVAPASPPGEGPAFLLNSKIKITDFGISKLLASKIQTPGASPGTDATMSAAGTPTYMSPEQFRGDPCTPATDVYALGVITYQALSGTPPFWSNDIRLLAFQHFQAMPAPIEDCSPNVNAVIQRALAKAPADRFQSALEFLDALERACLPPPPAVGIAPPILEPDGLDRAATWLGSHWWQLVLGVLLLMAIPIWMVLSKPLAPQPGPDLHLRTTRPSLGKVIDLPGDLDVVPVAQALPPPIAGRQRPIHPGPRVKPHALWTALLASDDFHAEPFVDGVSPDGTVYVRDESAKTLWAIDDTGFRWGYRAASPANLERLGLHQPSWPADSHVDFRDPGRIWLPSCSDSRACAGVVFNSAGVGGIDNQVPPPLRVPPATDFPISSDFEEPDAQTGRWPREHPRLQCNSRLGSVTLTNPERGWSVPLDGRCTKALESDGKLIVATNHNTIYAIDAAGSMAWTYTSSSEIHSMKAVPSGGVLLLSGKDHQTLEAIHAGTRQWQFDASGWIHQLPEMDSTGALYFTSIAGEDLVVYGVDTAGNLMWSLVWSGLNYSSEEVRLDGAGRLYLSGGRFEIGGKTRKGVVCLIE